MSSLILCETEMSNLLQRECELSQSLLDKIELLVTMSILCPFKTIILDRQIIRIVSPSPVNI